MTFANIQLPTDVVLDPFLEPLVSKLALDFPAFTFTTRGMSAQDIKYQTSGTSHQSRDTKAPEGKQFLRYVRVYQGAENLGSLTIDRRYGSRQSEDVYTIRSWRIDNQRGNMNESRTNKLNGAVRIVKRTFIPMNVVEIVSKAEGDMVTAFSNSIRDLTRPIQGTMLSPGTVYMQRYLYLLTRGEEVPDEMTRTIKDTFLSEKYSQAMLEHCLAEKMRGLPMATVVQRGTLFLIKRVGGQHPIYQKLFEELSEPVQNAIGVLQLMQDSELVDDVGYRYNDVNFFVVDKLFDTQ